MLGWRLVVYGESLGIGVCSSIDNYLSSMTSLSTFIIATAWGSVNPSSRNRWTNFRVSKWWSRDWRGVAWNALRHDGSCNMLVRGLWPLSMDRTRLDICWPEAGLCEFPLLFAAALNARIVCGGNEDRVCQLNLGSKNRGSVCTEFAIVFAIVFYFPFGAEKVKLASNSNLV